MPKVEMLGNIKHFLIEKIYPFVNELDSDTHCLQEIFNEFKSRGYFNVYVPEAYGGMNFSHEERMDFQETMGRMGGSFAFLQAQSASACWLIAQSKNEKLKQYYFSGIKNGDFSIANAISQMKSNGKNSIRGYQEKNGYRISGKVNFATGWKFFDKIVIGFYLGADQEVFAVIPFCSLKENNGSMIVNSVLETIGMESINTVSFQLENYFISNEDIIGLWPSQTFFENYKHFLPYAYAIGIAQEALDIVSRSFLFEENPTLRNKYLLLQEKLMAYRKQVYLPQQNKSSDDLFANMMHVTWLCMQFSLLVAGGLGLLNNSSIQRLYREIVIWFMPRVYPSTIESWVNQALCEKS